MGAAAGVQGGITRTLDTRARNSSFGQRARYNGDSRANGICPGRMARTRTVRLPKDVLSGRHSAPATAGESMPSPFPYRTRRTTKPASMDAGREVAHELLLEILGDAHWAPTH